MNYESNKFQWTHVVAPKSDFRDGHGRRYRTHPTGPDDHPIVRRCRRPIRFLLGLRVVGRRIEFSDTLYSVEAQTWI
jgi:hypothetical protein